MGCRLYSGGFLSLWGEVWQMWRVSYEFSLRVDWERFVVVFVVPGFIPFSYLYYMIVVLGSRRYCYHDWFMWGFLSLFGALVKGEFSGGAICVRGMWFGSECVPWLKRQPGGWLFSLVMELIFFGLLPSSSPLSVRIPHPVLMPNYWVRYSV